MILYVTFIQPERKLVNVAVQVLRADVMIDADQAALEDGKNAFRSVRSHVASHVFTSAVIDSGMGEAGMAMPEYAPPSSVCKVDPASTCL